MNNHKDDMAKPPTTVYPPEQQAAPSQVQQDVPVERLTASSKTVISITVAVAVAAVGWVTIRGDITANNKDVQALSKKVDRIEESLKAFDRLATLQSEIAEIKRNGSDALVGVKSEVDKLREAFRVHVARTTKDGDPFKE